MRSTRIARVGVLALVGLGGCQDVQLEPVEHPQTMGCSHCGPRPLSFERDVDILFVIDNSLSMGEEQAALARGFASMAEVLERPDVAANYRIGITTTDNGNPWCAGTTPEQGSMQASSCRSRLEEFSVDGSLPVDVSQSACTDLCPEEWSEIELRPTAQHPYDDELEPRPWIESIDGQTNLPKGLGLTQAFQCMAPQGIAGCGFEQPLESMWKAVRRSQTQGEPEEGFIRDHAVLSVVHVTDEADCSYNSAWDSVFAPDGGRVFWSDPEAASPSSAVCWNAGVRCQGTGTYDDCVPVDLDAEGNPVAADDADDYAVMRPMLRYVDALREIEENKQQLLPDQEVMVSIIAGAQSDGSVVYEDAGADPTFLQDFGIGPGCSGATGSAVPPVRLRDLAEQFSGNAERNMFSSCDANYSPALQAIGEAIAEQFQPACYSACVADSDPMTEVLEPSCVVLRETPNVDGEFVSVELSPCGPNGELPAGSDACYVERVGDALASQCADAGLNLELDIVRRPGSSDPQGTAYLAECERSADYEIDCPDLP